MKWSPTTEALIVGKILLVGTSGNVCMNSMENVNTDVRVQRADRLKTYGAEKLSKLSTSEFNLFRFNWNNPSAIDHNFKLWNVHWGKSYSGVQNKESKLTLLCAVWAFFCDDMKGRLLFREDLAMDGRRVGGTAIKNIELRELNY